MLEYRAILMGEHQLLERAWAATILLLAATLLSPRIAEAQTIVDALYSATITSVDAGGRPISIQPGDPILLRIEYDADAMEFMPPSGQFADALVTLEISFPVTGEFFATDQNSTTREVIQIDNLGAAGVALTDSFSATGDLATTELISGITPLVGGISLTERVVGLGVPDLVVDASKLPDTPPDVSPTGAVTFMAELEESTTATVTIEGDNVQLVPEPRSSLLVAAALASVGLLRSRSVQHRRR